ncbi:MAG: penicillin-binding protein 2 [Leptospirales bacterium]
MFGSATQARNWNRIRKRMLFMIVIIALGFFSLLFRLLQLQVIDGEAYYKDSKRVIRKIVVDNAPRGQMFYRNYQGRENSSYVAQNTTTLTLIAVPDHFDKGELYEKTLLLEEAYKITDKSLVKKITPEAIRKKMAIVLLENLTPKDLSILADYYLHFHKFIIKENTKRFYNDGEKTAHITGYIGPPNKKDIAAGIRSYQLVGKNGLEKYYDSILRGQDGEIVQITTATGNFEEQKIFRSFVPGNNLVLTVDEDLQKAAWKSIQGRKGAIMVLKPATGEILALVSQPDYNPNTLLSDVPGERKKHLAYIRSSYAEINRAISAKFPPASTFKPLVAIAGMEEKFVSSDLTFYCPGKFVMKSSYSHLPDSTFHCWKTHRKNNLITAIRDSCSVYFYRLGLRIGAEPIMNYSRHFKLNEVTNIDLPGEIAGFVPSKEWKQSEFHQGWYDGDTVNLSIGQGFIETTLIGMVNFYAAIASGGIVYKPHLVKEIRFAENDQIKESIIPQVLYELPHSKLTMDTIREGLRQVVSKGTARWVLNRPYLMPIAGKTGTVQTRSFDRHANKTQHAWFIGYGPYNGDINKTIVVGVFIEQGVSGSVGAAPIAHDIFKVWSNKLKGNLPLD